MPYRTAHNLNRHFLSKLIALTPIDTVQSTEVLSPVSLQIMVKLFFSMVEIECPLNAP